MNFELNSPYQPAGDQPQAIAKLVHGLKSGRKHQVLLGVTGSGKTFTMANVINQIQRPTLVISHNKTLAGQLAQEYKESFPNNAVEYFVSYYDYYQPEAYIPQRDQYIEKEAQINQEIDRLRLSTTNSLLTRKDVIVVASVSAIYNLGSPAEYEKSRISIGLDSKGSNPLGLQRSEVLKKLIDIYYERNDFDFQRSTFRVRGEFMDVWPSYDLNALRLEFDQNDKLKLIKKINPLTGQLIETLTSAVVYPAKHYISNRETYDRVFNEIKEDLGLRIYDLKKQGKELEAHRLKQKTNYDLETIKSLGYCSGIENYSRYFDGRKTGEPPFTLLDYFRTQIPDLTDKDPGSSANRDWMLIVDESHITLPQIRGMYNGDKVRKQTLIDYGFRLPSAADNRPLRFDEFMRRIPETIYTSATPSEWEVSISNSTTSRRRLLVKKSSSQDSGVVEQLVRPTGLIDPEIEIRKSSGQIDNLLKEIEIRVSRHERVLVTTLTKRMAEELSDYLAEKNIKVNYLHSDVETLERSDILDDLRRGNYDVLVGINLLREGLDLPEVSLVVILDADKEGFLRSRTSLIQTMGRAARHINGKVIMYADHMTGSMQEAIDEVNRRRIHQINYNKKNKITPQSITKSIRDRLIKKEEVNDAKKVTFTLKQIMELSPSDRKKALGDLEQAMKEASEYLDFEMAAKYRDLIIKIKKVIF